MTRPMRRPIWSGTITFGLLNIPVSMTSTKEAKPISFHLLDKNDHSRIGYKQYNKSTGEEISRDDIVKGYEYQPDRFVIVTDKDFQNANPKATRTIEIEDFVDLAELDPLLFERPYVLHPQKNGERSFSLLKKVMDHSSKVAIGRLVLHGRQRLVALLVRNNTLICEVLRYANEIEMEKDIEKEIPPSKREVEIAERLVEDMSAKWDPRKYKDTYRNDLLKRIRQKIKGRGTVTAKESEENLEDQSTKIVDLMPLLRKSLKSVNANKGRRKKSR